MEWPAIPPYRIRIENARNGETVPVIEMGGQTFAVGSRYEPSKDATRFAERLDVLDRDLVVLVGGGAHTAEALLKTGNSFYLAYLEPFPELHADLSGRDSRLHSFTSPDELIEHIRSMGIDDLSRFRFVLHPSLARPLRDYAAAVSRAARQAFEETISGALTLAAVGDLIIKNILENLSAFGSMKPVQALFASSEGSVACVVGSGPSLDQSAPEIARWKDRMQVIATDSAVLPLIEHGIVADLAVCLDPRPEALEHVDALPEALCASMSWVVSAGIHPSVRRRLKDFRLFVFTGDHPLELWLAEHFGAPGSLACGGSVILPAFDLACRTGAAEILLAGADFSFGDGQMSHSKETAGMKKTLSASTRFDTVETSAQMNASEKAPRRVEFNRTSYRTGENLLAYRKQLESLVSQFTGRCRQMYPALAIPGAEGCKSLRDFENRPIRYRGDSSSPSAPASAGWAEEAVLKNVKDEVGRRISAGIERDPLFRTAVEAAVFRRIRATHEPAAAVLPRVSREVAGELKQALDAAREDR